MYGADYQLSGFRYSRTDLFEHRDSDSDFHRLASLQMVFVFHIGAVCFVRSGRRVSTLGVQSSGNHDAFWAILYFVDSGAFTDCHKIWPLLV